MKGLLPVLLAMLAASPATYAQGIEDFSNLSRAKGKEVSIVDRSGVIRKGIVEAAAAEGVTLRIGTAAITFARAEVASAARAKDGRIDGAIKGALLGLVLYAVASKSCDAQPCPRPSRVPIVGLTAVGYVIDATEGNGRPLYRAPSVPAPTLNISLRF